MTSILGSEDHLYLLDDLSAPSIDSVGSNDSTSVNGMPSFSSNGVTTDGADDAVIWNSTNKPYDAAQDFTVYLVMNLLEALDGNTLVLASQDNANGPAILWDDFGSPAGRINAIRVFSNNAGDVIVNLPLGEEPTVTDKIAVAFSFNRTTKVLNAAVRSSTGANNSGTNTGTIATSAGGFNLGSNSNVNGFFNAKFLKMGSINGTAHSVEDLEDTVTILLDAGPTEEAVRRALYLLGSRGDRG